LNLRPPEPHSGALPDCATSRQHVNLTGDPSGVNDFPGFGFGLLRINFSGIRPVKKYALGKFDHYPPVSLERFFLRMRFT
jgi:hypothetical protein